MKNVLFFAVLSAVFFTSMTSQATVLGSATTCKMANLGTELTVVLDQQENAVIEIMIDQSDIQTEEVIVKNYREEIVDAYGVKVPVYFYEYNTVNSNHTTIIKANGSITGHVKGPLSENEKVGLYACRTFLDWE